MTECPCSRPTAAWLCGPCVAGLLDDLAAVDEVLDRLEAAKVGDTPRPSNGNSGPTGSKPPVNLTITTSILNIELLLRAMGGHIDKRWLRDPGTEGLADVIINNIAVLAAQKFIIDYQQGLRHEMAIAEKYLNPTPEQQLLGPCQNDGTPLSAAEDAHEVRCPTCGDTFSITLYRLGRILTALGDDGTPVRASEAVRRFNTAGLQLTAKTVENWVKYEYIHPVAVDEHQRRLFSLSDIYAKFAGTYSS